MKDPAVLFYFQDFLVGTEFMTDDEVGKYIRILCHQADKGALTELQLKRICRTNLVPDAIMEKLRQDENGNYYQQRMKIEREKRVSYSDSRRKNRESKKEDVNNICKTYEKHMENENEIEDESINSNRRIKKFVKPTLEEVEKYFFENGYRPEIGKKAWMGYDTANWFDSKGQQIKNWKQKMINVWFRDEHKISKSGMVY